MALSQTSIVGTPPAILDEETLRRLAAEPRRELFPVLSQARAMRPLIFLIAVVPALISATRYTLSEGSAWQGLAALHVLQAESGWMLVDPAHGTEIDGQPPLSSWLTAAAMRVFGSATTAGMTAATCLGVAVLVLAAAMLARRCGGDRAALVAALCMALNPAVIRQTQSPGPAALGAGLAGLALVALVEHWQRATTPWSRYLLMGGALLGASVLCAPLIPLVAISLAILSAIVSALWRRPETSESPGDSWYPADCQKFSRIQAVIRWSLLGFLVGGWWPILKTLADGPVFWGRAWLLEQAATVPMFSDAPSQTVRFHSECLLVILWPLVGLIILGVISVFSNELPGRRPDRPGRRGVLLVGLIATVIAGCVWDQWGPPVSGAAAAIQLFLLIPPTVCAAIGFLRVVDRRVNLEQVAGAVAGAAAAGGISWWLLRPELGPGESIIPRIGSGIALSGALLLLGWLAGGYLAVSRVDALSRDLPRRIALGGGLMLMLLLTAAWGLSSAAGHPAGDRDLAEMRQGLRQIGDRKRIVLLSPDREDPAPPELEFLVRAVWPLADTRRAVVWPEPVAPQQLLSEEPEIPGEFLLVTWSPTGGVRASVPADRLRPLGPALRFRRGEVAQYDYRD